MNRKKNLTGGTISIESNNNKYELVCLRDMNSDNKSKSSDIIELLAKIFKHPNEAKEIFKDYTRPLNEVKYKISTNILTHFKNTSDNQLVKEIIEKIEQLINVMNDDVENGPHLTRKKIVITSNEIYDRINKVINKSPLFYINKEALANIRTAVAGDEEDSDEEGELVGGSKNRKTKKYTNKIPKKTINKRKTKK